jgi:hypothetical protein
VFTGLQEPGKGVLSRLLEVKHCLVFGRLSKTPAFALFCCAVSMREIYHVLTSDLGVLMDSQCTVTRAEVSPQFSELALSAYFILFHFQLCAVPWG